MKRLIKKDFISYWQLIAVMAFYVPFLTSIALWAMMDDFGGVAIWFITMLVAAMCIATSFIFIISEEHKNGNVFYSSLPVKRASIVLAKYISSLINLILSFLISVLTVWFVSGVSYQHDNAFDLMLKPEGIIVMFSFISLVLFYLLPYIIGFGPGRGFFISVFVTIIIALFEPFTNFLKSLSSGRIDLNFSFITGFLKSSFHFLKMLPDYQKYSLLIGVLIFAFFISLLISIKLFSKRDLG